MSVSCDRCSERTHNLEMCDSSVVQGMYGSSVIQKMYGSSVVQKWSADAKIETKNDNAVIIDRANKKILVCDKEMVYP